MPQHNPFRPMLFIAALLVVPLLAACMPQQSTSPVLVTLPAADLATAEPSATSTTADASITETATPNPPPLTPTSTQLPAITPTLPLRGAESVGFVWEADSPLRPAALAPSRDRVAVLGTDGRFAWLSAGSGEVTAQTALWPGTTGETQGEVYTDGQLVVVAAMRQITDEDGDVSTQARLAAVDASAGELWTLPERRTGHGYTAMLIDAAVVVGRWPRGGGQPALAAYDPLTGDEVWRITTSGQTPGLRPLLADGVRLYALLDTIDGRGVIAFDTAAGEELWRWLPEEEDAAPPEQVALDDGVLFVLGADRLWALNASTGAPRGSKAVEAAPQVGFDAQDGLLTFSPAPNAANAYRPGLLTLDATSGDEVMRALGGEFVDALVRGENALWALAKDYDDGAVMLAPLDAAGEPLARVEVGTQPGPDYALVPFETRVYVLGETVQAFGY